MKSIIVTGGAGFIGSNLAKHYLKKGVKVYIYDNLERNGCKANLEWLDSLAKPGQLVVIVGDVRKPTKELEKAVEDSDALFHFAGQVAVTRSVVDPREDFEVNALGTFNMLELVRTIKPQPFLFSSSIKVYGGLENIKVVNSDKRYRYADYPNGIAEDRLLDFHSPYGCSKGAADQYVRDYSRIYDLPTVVFRQSCIYGYRQFGIEDQGWVAWFVIASILKKPITIYGDGMQIRDILFIDDLVNAYDMAITNIGETNGKIYNIGGGPENTLSLLELVAHLSKRGIDITPTFTDWRPGDQPVCVSDISKAEREFGWKPEVGAIEGVDLLTDWVEERIDEIKPLFP